MKQDRLQTISIEQFRAMFPDRSDVDMDKDFFLADVRYSSTDQNFRYPFRVDGYVAILSVEGNLNVSLNLQTYMVRPHEMILYIPGNIMRVEHFDSPGRVVVIAVSREFMSSIRIDFNALFNDSMAVLSSPCIRLNESEYWLFARYAQLCSDLIKTAGQLERREALGALISSFYYALGTTWSRRLSDARNISGNSVSSRSKSIFDQFMRLVNEFHTEHRNMDFYAGRMCLTSKYLSKIVKQVSGRSAPEWIDSFVILEAKNMLRYSAMPIKEIVYNLNFVNHSVFYKFFKSHTGMTPSEYRSL